MIIYFRGGAYERGVAAATDASYDGDIEFDDNGASYVGSNWVNASGVGVRKPQDGDTIYFGQFATLVPADYSDSTYPHVIGKHFCACKNLDQADMDLLDVNCTGLFTGDVYEYNSDLLTAAANASADSGNKTLIRIDGHTMSVGDFVTFGLTVSHSGEYRITTSITDYITIDKNFVPETFTAIMTAVARTPLRFTNTGTVVVESPGRIYLECGDAGGGGDGDNIPALVFNSANTGILQISSDGVTGGGAEGIWNDILVLGAGTMKVMKNSYFTKMTIPGDSTAATVIVEEGCEGPSSASADLDIFAGTVTWDSKLGDTILAGGEVTYCENVDLTTTVDVDNILGYGGKIYLWGKGSLKDFTVYDGEIIAKGDADKVIGSAASSYKQYGGSIDLSQAGGVVSLYSGADIDRKGGVLKLPLRINASW